MGTSYIRIVGFSYILNSLSSIYIGMQQSIENPRFGMTVFAISTVCNTVGNYILIFGKLGLPKPDLVLYLDMPTGASVSLLRHREAATHTQADIHERDNAYLAACRETASHAADVLGWQRIPCTENGQVRTVETIHQDVWNAVKRCLTETKPV